MGVWSDHTSFGVAFACPGRLRRNSSRMALHHNFYLMLLGKLIYLWRFRLSPIWYMSTGTPARHALGRCRIKGEMKFENTRCCVALKRTHTSLILKCCVISVYGLSRMLNIKVKNMNTAAGSRVNRFFVNKKMTNNDAKGALCNPTKACIVFLLKAGWAEM